MIKKIKFIFTAVVIISVFCMFSTGACAAEKDEIWTYFSNDEHGSSFVCSTQAQKPLYAVCYIPETYEKVVAITAVYTGQSLVRVDMAPIGCFGKNVIDAGTIEYGEVMRLFLLESSENVKPLCKPETISTESVDLSSVYFCEDFESTPLGDDPASLSIKNPEYVETVTDPRGGGSRVLKADTTSVTGGIDVHMDKQLITSTDWVSLSFDMYAEEFNSTALRTYIHDGDEWLIQMQIGKVTKGKVRIYDTTYGGDKWFDSTESTLDGWCHINIIHKIAEKKIDLYVNGELSVEDVNMTSQTFANKLKFFRIQLYNKSREKVYLDNIKLYASKDIYVPEFILKAMPVDYVQTKPISPRLSMFDSVTEYITSSPTSYIEGYDEVKAKYAGSLCFVADNKNAWLSDGRYAMPQKPYIDNNVFFVPAQSLAAALGVDYSYNSVAGVVNIGGVIINEDESRFMTNGKYIGMRSPMHIKNSEAFVPLKEIVKAFGKYYFESVKGIAFVSDTNLAIKDELAISSDLYVPDYVLMMNYIIYERPNAQHIKALIESANPGFERPYIYSTPRRLAALKERVKTDSILKSWSDLEITRANAEAAKTDLPVQVFDAQNRFSGTPHINTILGLCWAHYMTGDDKYSDRAIDLALTVAGWETWSAQTHYISVCSPVDVCAAVLDLLYDELTETEKSTLKNAIYNLAVAPGLDVYYGRLLPNYPPHMRNNNWNSSSNSAVVVGALAVLDTLETENCYDAIEKAIASLERMLHNFAPDGGWYESLGYWQATVTDVTQMISSLQNASGSHFSLINAPGFALTGMYPFYISGNAGGFAYHDSPRITNVCPPESHWFAEITNNPSIEAIYKKFKKDNNYSSSPKDILYYYMGDEVAVPELPLDVHIGGVEVASMRSDWTFDKSNVFAAIHAGYNSAIHGQFDMGTFEYSAFKTKFATDMGSDDYNLPGYWARTGIYVHRAEGHNVYVLDPDETAGQHEEAYSVINEVASKPDGAIYTIDMTSAYAHQGVRNAIRGFRLSDSRKVFTIQDEITSDKAHDTHWFWHTPADTKLGVDGKSVVLTSGLNVVTLYFDSNVDFEIVLRKSTPLATSPQNDSQLSNMTNLVNLVEVIFDTSEETTVFRCVAVPQGVSYTDSDEILPISEWEVD
ncbi:MAG: DUF4962 domain-containing protein [Clostridia bacterium]|nr:DUF4962 domain-containing protein [Clostridia bacterium]